MRGKHNDAFNHQTYDVREGRGYNDFLFFENISMNDSRIYGLPQPSGPNQPATEIYVDNTFMTLDGSHAMTGNLQMGSKKITDLADPSDNTDVVNKKYVDSKATNVDLTAYFKKRWFKAMTGDLQMGKKVIDDLETPNDVPITDLVNYRKDAYHAANKEYLRQNFLKKDENGGDDYDIKQKVNRNAEPYRDRLFNDNDLVSKAFVDAEIAKLPKNVLKLDGSQAMRGNLRMGDHIITGIRSSSQDNAALTVGGAKSIYLPLAGNKGMQGALHMGNNTIRNLKMPANNPSSGNPPDDCAINFKYFNDQALKRKITQKIEANLDMGDNNIITLKDPLPLNSQHAASVNFVHKSISDSNVTISNLIDSKVAEVEALNTKASKRENVFSFVMDNDLFKDDDDDITKVGKVEKDFYDINQAT